MRTYVCYECDDRTDDCTAYVFDRTPEDFDKSIMDVFCKRCNKKPIWKKREEISYYDTI